MEKEVEDILINEYERRFVEFESLARALSERAITGFEALLQTNSFLDRCTELERKWYRRVLKKDLDIGVGTKTFNKVSPDLIFEWPCQLAKTIKTLPAEFTMEPKYDGIRILASTTDHGMYSRKGLEKFGFDAIIDDLEYFPEGYMLDGELMGISFNDINGLVTEKSNGKRAIYYVFDIIPEADFNSNSCKLTQKERRAILESFFDNIGDLVNYIKLTPSSPIIKKSDPDRQNLIDSFYAEKLEEGLEGIIIKNQKSLYKGSRTTAWQKLKPLMSWDLLVIGVAPGEPETRYEFLVSKLICEFGDYEVRVSGIKDEQKIAWTNDPSLIIGKVVEVLGQETTDNKKGTKSIRFPRFSRIRRDK